MKTEMDGYYNALLASMERTADSVNGDDFYLVLGYAPENVRPDFNQAHDDLTALVDAIRKRREAQGVPFYFDTRTHSRNGEPVTMHRMIVTRGQDTPEELAALWPHGPVYCVPISERGTVEDVIGSLYFD